MTGINLVIAVTDGEWFEMLRRQPNLSEVNFWSPSPRNFHTLQPGELFLFKLHAPHNVIDRWWRHIRLFQPAALFASLGCISGGERRAVSAGDANANHALSQDWSG